VAIESPISGWLPVLLLACVADPVDVSLARGWFRSGDDARRAVALARGVDPGDLDVVAVAGGCGAPGWRPVAGDLVSHCDEPLLLEGAPDARRGGVDVLLVIVDTLRPDHVGPERTPVIAAHAARGWWPERAYSPSPWTQPAVAALFTGRPPWALYPEPYRELPDHVTTWPEQVEGRERWLIGTNPFVSEKRGFHQGFERAAMAAGDRAAVALARTWWEEPRRGDRLLVVHLIGPHLPYAPAVPPPGTGERVGDHFDDLDHAPGYGPVDRARIAALYAADVAEVDARVGELLELVGEEAVTAVVSDHGEELWEHGGFEHGHAMWEEVVRVHAALSVPGAVPERPAGPVRLQDVAQRIALAAGAPADPGWSPPTDLVRLGYASKRRPAIHTDGLIAPEGVLLRGAGRHVEGDEAALEARLARMGTAGWHGERSEQTWCEVEVEAGERLVLPGRITWSERAPPGAGGRATRRGSELVIEPTRSGTWEVEGLGGGTCRVERAEHFRAFDELEEQALRALGYLD